VCLIGLLQNYGTIAADLEGWAATSILASSMPYGQRNDHATHASDAGGARVPQIEVRGIYCSNITFYVHVFEQREGWAATSILASSMPYGQRNDHHATDAGDAGAREAEIEVRGLAERGVMLVRG
jgi:hypothetical protein